MLDTIPFETSEFSTVSKRTLVKKEKLRGRPSGQCSVYTNGIQTATESRAVGPKQLGARFADKVREIGGQGIPKMMFGIEKR